MSRNRWTEEDVPSQSGKVALVTGANSGIGFETARVLAEKDAHVVMACRNQQKAESAMAAIRGATPSASLTFLPLDLSSLKSVEQASKQFLSEFDRLDLLINNAGVMWLPESRTADGFEAQFGTNHLGHFALTGRLIATVMNTSTSRVVTVSSLAHNTGDIHFDDLNLEQGYGKHKAYSQSKLANLIFAYELQRRLSAAGASTISLAAHPGAANTNLAIPGFEKGGSKVMAKLAEWITPVLTQNAVNGALPTLYAATSPKLGGGEYIGPDGFQQMYGYPKVVGSTRLSRDEAVARRLWEVSEEMTGVGFEFEVRAEEKVQ